MGDAARRREVESSERTEKFEAILGIRNRTIRSSLSTHEIPLPEIQAARAALSAHPARSRRATERDTELSGAPIEILLVEDNPADVCLVQESFEGGKVLNSLHVVGDGAEAIAFLHRNGRYANAPRPDLILLDLYLPKKNGFEVLAEVKREECLMTIPVVVLTSSRTDLDVLKTYELQGNCYIEKPVNLEKLVNVLTVIKEFWLTIVRLPESEIPR